MHKKFRPTPHDALFKQFLGIKETAKDFLEIWLPDNIKALCDLETIKLESGSFIDEKLKNYQSDVLYSVNTAQGEGYFYCLIEHQSIPDKLIAWRLMRYSMAVMQQHLEQSHNTLPLGYPCYFTAECKVLTPTVLTGWIALKTENWLKISIPSHLVLPILRWSMIMKLCSTAVWHY